MICLYLYEYLLLWDILYIIGNSSISAFQYKFDHANLSSCSWDISKQSFYSCWWSDILVVCCHFYTSDICVDSLRLGLFSTTYFVKIGPLVVDIQAESSLWHYCYTKKFNTTLSLYKVLRTTLYFSKSFLEAAAEAL